jgi:hypothetical protein
MNVLPGCNRDLLKQRKTMATLKDEDHHLPDYLHNIRKLDRFGNQSSAEILGFRTCAE